MLPEQKWRCDDCNGTAKTSELLRSKNPFMTSEDITGCPACYAINSMALVCDEEGCNNLATCGIPSSDGYRRVCGTHWSHIVKAEKMKEARLDADNQE